MHSSHGTFVSFVSLLTFAAIVHSLPESVFVRRQDLPAGNTSVLPPGWSGQPQCWEDFTEDPTASFLLGPTLTSSAMTVELCVNFCNNQDYRLAGVVGGDGCHCANFFNPFTGFESDGNECEGFGGLQCAGNPDESCGSTEGDFLNIYFNTAANTCVLWPGGASLTSGPWRLIFPYNDTVGARALPHNAVDLHLSLPRGNLTIEACVNVCAANNFSLAGVEFADECYCGNALGNNAQPIPGCTPGPTAGGMSCKGDSSEVCGGPDLIFIYGLPTSGLTPLLPFDPIFNRF